MSDKLVNVYTVFSEVKPGSVWEHDHALMNHIPGVSRRQVLMVTDNLQEAQDCLRNAQERPKDPRYQDSFEYYMETTQLPWYLVAFEQ